MKRRYNWLLYQAIKNKFQFDYASFSDEENFIIDYDNSFPEEHLWFTKKDSILRDFENFISVIFFIIFFGPLRLISTFIYGVYAILIYLFALMFFLSLLLPGLRDVFFG